MALQVAHGGEKSMAQVSRSEGRESVPNPRDVSLPSRNRNDGPTPKMGADIEALINNGNVVVKPDGTVEFKARAKEVDSEIKYSVKKFSENNSELISLATDQPVGNLVDKNGYDLVADSSLKQPGYRNAFLTLGKDIERFTIEIDGKIYIIDRKVIAEYKDGPRSSQVIQHSEQSSDSGNSPTSRLPVSKYRELENVTLTPSGEVKFELTTKANNLLLHYERQDGSRSESGYSTVFRYTDCYNSRTKGAYHEDRTFTLDVEHLDSRTVRANFILDREVTHATVILDGKSYYIDTAELRNYINSERTGSKQTAPTQNASESRPEDKNRTDDSAGSSSGGESNTPQQIAEIQNKENQTKEANEEAKAASETSYGTGVERTKIVPQALGAVGVERSQAKNAARAELERQGLPPTSNSVEAKIRSSSELLAEIKGQRPTTYEGRLEALEKLNQNERAAFKALDKEAKALEAKTRSRIPFRSGLSVNDPEFAALEEKLRVNSTHKAELVTEKAKLLAEIANETTDAKVKSLAQRELVRIKPEITKAYDKLIQLEADVNIKQTIQQTKAQMVQTIESTNLTRGQKVSNAIANLSETLNRTPKYGGKPTIYDTLKAGAEYAIKTRPIAIATEFVSNRPTVQTLSTWYNHDSIAKVNEIATKSTTDLIKDGFSGDKALKLDNALSKEATKLQAENLSGKNFPPEKEARLNSINEARSKLAQTTKVFLEEISNSPAGTHPEKLVNSAKKALYEIYGERIEADLATKAATPEGNEFLRERGNHLASQALSDTKLNKLPVIKEAFEAFKQAELSLQRAGATPADSLTAEVEFRKHALETAKVKHLLSQEGITDSLKRGLEAAKLKSVSLGNASLADLETKLNAEITAATPEQQAALRERLSNVQAEKVRIQGQSAGAMIAERVASNQAVKDALSTLKQAENTFRSANNAANELAVKDAKLKLATARFDALTGVEIAGCDANIRVLNQAIAQLNTDLAVGTITEADKALKEGEKRLIEKDLVKQQEIKADYEAKRPLLDANKSLAQMELDLHIQEKPASGPVNQAEVDRLRGELEVKRGEIASLETVRASAIKAKFQLADTWINNKCSKFSNNPMKSLAVYTALTSGLKAAIHSETDPDSTHTFLPAFLADLKWEPAERLYSWSVGTTEEFGSAGSRWRDGFSYGLDAGGRFAVIGGGFHLINSGVSAGYNKFTGGQGGRFGSIVGNGVNAGFVGYMAYESGKSAYEGGQFIDYRGDHVTALDNVDILIPGVMNTVMGSTVKWGRYGGLPGIVGAAALQAAGTVHGINIALDKVDADGNMTIAKRGVIDSLDAAFHGFVMPLGEDGRPIRQDRKEDLTKEQEEAFEDIARSKLFEHFQTAYKPSAAGAVLASNPKFYGFSAQLNSYSKEELSQLGLSFTNANDPKEKAANIAAFEELFSKDRTFWVGSTHFEGLPEELQKKVTNDRLALKGFYHAIHDSSLGKSYESVDNSSTKSLSWSAYFGAIDTSEEWKNNKLGGTVKRTDFLANHCRELSASADFSELVNTMESPTANNGFLLLNLLATGNHIPGTDDIIQTQEGLGRLVRAFHSKEEGKPYKFGKMMTDFAKYSKDVTADPDFQQFVRDVNSNGTSVNDVVDERFDKYFPGITLYLVKGEAGMNAIRTVLGDEHPLYQAINKTFSEHLAKLQAASSEELSMP